VKDDRIYLRHIVEAIEDIEKYTASGYAAFICERMRQDAVIRKLEVIGEAVKQLSPAAKATRVDIQWREIAAMRDKMIHEYFGVNLEIVWTAVEHSLPELKQAAEEILAAPQDIR
jgi:uncharacterized protein with HEPN domain